MKLVTLEVFFFKAHKTQHIFYEECILSHKPALLCCTGSWNKGILEDDCVELHVALSDMSPCFPSLLRPLCSLLSLITSLLLISFHCKILVMTHYLEFAGFTMMLYEIIIPLGEE
jgi:hypothetical protein